VLQDFTLDMAVDFLPLMQELLSSRFEDYIVVALEMTGVILKVTLHCSMHALRCAMRGCCRGSPRSSK